jgi:prepilin-type N-terminal cleavage/methylation domain-containing protein
MKKNKYTSRGFTLIELIIVLAIFGVLMVGVISLIDPVSKIMTKASTSASTSAAVDNMRRTIDSSLRYARYVDVYTDGFYNSAAIGETPQTAQTEQEAVENFCATYLDGLVAYDDASNTAKLVSGRIRVLTIDNNDSSTGRGRIYESTYKYNSVEQWAGVDRSATSYTANPQSVTPEKSAELIVNPVYYDDSKSNYGYYISLGTGGVEYISDSDADALLGGDDTTPAAVGYEKDYKNRYGKLTDSNVSNFSDENFTFTITYYKENIWDIGGETYVKGPFASTVSSLGLVNINAAKNIFGSTSYMADPFYVHTFNPDGSYVMDSSTGTISLTPHTVSQAMRVFDTGDCGTFTREFSSLSTEVNASPNNKIVIVYVLNEEINL